jgi:type II secretion system protein N
MKIQLSDRAKRLLRVFLVFPSYFLCCLFSSAYQTFPYDRVRDFAVEQVGRAMPGAELEIVSLEPAWVSGVEAEGVVLRLPAGPGEERPSEVTLRRVYARAGILSYLFGTTSVSYAIETDGGGLIEGYLDDSTSGEGQDATGEIHLVAHITNVDLRRIGLIRHFAHIPFEGMVSGEIDVTLAHELDGTTGTITMTIAGLALGDGHAEVPIPGMSRGIAVERLDAGNLSLQVQIEHGVGRIQQLSSDGEDAQVQGQGTVRLLRPFAMSALDVLVRINVAPSYRERNDRTRAVFGFADMSGEVRPYRAPDGAYQVRLQGAIGGRLQAMPAGTATLDP